MHAGRVTLAAAARSAWQQNAEVRFRWCMLGVKNEHAPTLALVRVFLTAQGKQKFTVPLYDRMLHTSPATKALAADIFAATQAALHVSLRNRVATLLAASA